MVLIFHKAPKYCTWVFYFKDYNTTIQISSRKKKFKRFWWLAPHKSEYSTFLENWSKNCKFHLHQQGFSKHFLLHLFGGKNLIFNWVSKVNPPSFIISVFQFYCNCQSSISDTLSTRKGHLSWVTMECLECH